MASSRGSGNASCYQRGSALPPQETARSDDGAGVLAPRGTGDPPPRSMMTRVSLFLRWRGISEEVVGGASVVLELLFAALGVGACRREHEAAGARCQAGKEEDATVALGRWR